MGRLSLLWRGETRNPRLRKSGAKTPWHRLLGDQIIGTGIAMQVALALDFQLR